jgi:hypothetical protein
MVAEANLLEPPRLTLRRFRSGEPALASLRDGIAEVKAVFGSTTKAFLRKLGGTSSYDGLPGMIAAVHSAVVNRSPQPISLAEMDDVTRLVDRFTDTAVEL